MGINPRNHFGPGFGLGQLLVVYEGSFRQQQASPTLANTPQLLPKKISYSPPKTGFQWVESRLLLFAQWAASWSFQEEVDGFPLKTSNEAVARRKYFKVSTLLYKHILIKDLLDPLDR